MRSDEIHDLATAIVVELSRHGIYVSFNDKVRGVSKVIKKTLEQKTKQTPQQTLPFDESSTPTGR